MEGISLPHGRLKTLAALHCRAVAATVSATTVESQLAHSAPTPHPISFLAPTCLPARSTISRYCDTNCYDN